jgi:hypothetical protein
MSPPAAAGPTFAFFRTLGNDSPPLHSPTQTVDNLRFILEHEPRLEGCVKHFILNRIVDPARVELLLKILSGAGLMSHVVPFDRHAFQSLPGDEERWAYLTNNNPARNLALELGAALADFVLPFDGQIFMTQEGWNQIRAEVAAHPGCPAFVVPMTRLLMNDEALSPSRINRDEMNGPSEPQLLFSSRCPERFDETIPYGSGPKMEMLIRLGVPGGWNKFGSPYWRSLQARPRSPFAGQCLKAGYVYRLASGNAVASMTREMRSRTRRESIESMIENARRVPHPPRA